MMLRVMLLSDLTCHGVTLDGQGDGTPCCQDGGVTLDGQGDDTPCYQDGGVFHNVLYTMGFERVKITPVKVFG